MPNIEIELNPVDFITIGTVGPKGQRVFHLQAAQGDQVACMIIEKEQAAALSEAVRELLEDLDKRFPPPEGRTSVNLSEYNMELRDPVSPLFRIAQMGLGYDEDRNMIVLVAQELVTLDEGVDPDTVEPGIVRMWCTRPQIAALSQHAMQTVQAGRPDPRLNGRLVYYWT